MESLWKVVETVKLPNGTTQYTVRKTRNPTGSTSRDTIPHECPHCGGIIYYRFGEILPGAKKAYIDDHPMEDEKL